MECPGTRAHLTTSNPSTILSAEAQSCFTAYFSSLKIFGRTLLPCVISCFTKASMVSIPVSQPTLSSAEVSWAGAVSSSLFQTRAAAAWSRCRHLENWSHSAGLIDLICSDRLHAPPRKQTCRWLHSSWDNQHHLSRPWFTLRPSLLEDRARS